MPPEKSDSKNLLLSLRGDFYFLYFTGNFLLIEVVNPLFLMKLIDDSKPKVLVYIWFMGTRDFVSDIRWFLWGVP